MPSVERWYVLLSVVRRYVSFIVSGTSMNYLFYIISGTVVYLSCLQWNVGMCYRQWYDGTSFYIINGTVVYLSMPSVERWYVLSSVVRRYISFIVNGTSMNHLFISSMVRWYISSCLQWNIGMC